jgi:hypothetical protein
MVSSVVASRGAQTLVVGHLLGHLEKVSPALDRQSGSLGPLFDC